MITLVLISDYWWINSWCQKTLESTENSGQCGSSMFASIIFISWWWWWHISVNYTSQLAALSELGSQLFICKKW